MLTFALAIFLFSASALMLILAMFFLKK